MHKYEWYIDGCTFRGTMSMISIQGKKKKSIFLDIQNNKNERMCVCFLVMSRKIWFQIFKDFDLTQTVYTLKM